MYRVVPGGRFAIQRMPFAVAGSRWARHPRLPRVVSRLRFYHHPYIPPEPGRRGAQGYASGALIQYEIEGDAAGRFIANETDVRRM